jgi:hypothetical protein
MLWWLESELPDVAAKVSRQLFAHASEVIARPLRRRVGLGTLGCFALDRQILFWAEDDDWNESDKADELEDLISDELGFTERETAISLIHQRVSAWNTAGARIHYHAVEALTEEITPTAAKGFVPQGGDWFVLDTSQGEPAGLVACARRLGEQLGDVIDRLTKYEALGFDVPTLDRAAAATLHPTFDDITFLSRNLDAAPPWISGSAPVLHALKAMTALGKSAEHVLQQYNRYRCLGVAAPRISADQLIAAIPADPIEWILLTGELKQDVLGIAFEISFEELIRRAARVKLALVLALRRVRNLGIYCPSFEFEPDPDYVPTEIDYIDLGFVHSANHPQGHLGAFLTMTCTPDVSPELSRQRRDLARRAGVVPVTCTDEIFESLHVDEVDLKLLSRAVDGEPPWLARWIPSTHIRTAAKKLRLKTREVKARLRRLAPLGVEIVEVSGSVDGGDG